MANEKRRDNRGRILKDGEDQLADGRYRYRYYDIKGDRQSIYSWRLVPTDRIPSGKRKDISLREKEEAIKKDGFDGIDGRLGNRMTLNEMFEIYMSGKEELKDSTRVNYTYMYNKYVLDDFGKRKIASIKYSDVKAFYNSLLKEKGFKTNSLEGIHTIIHPIFTLAVRDGYIRNNPSDGVMAEIKKSHNWEKAKRHALTLEEQAALIQYTADSETYNHWLPLLTTALGTGLRIGELLGLRWCDCSFVDKTISVNHNLLYRQQRDGRCIMRITTPKTAAGCRLVPMLDEVKTALLKERKKQMMLGGCKAEVDGYTDFVFTNRNGYVHNPSTINRALKRIYTAYNREETLLAKAENREPMLIRHFTAHNLRHTFCTRLCENDVNLKVIQEIMGHSDISTSMNIYAEVSETKKKETLESVKGKFKIS